MPVPTWLSTDAVEQKPPPRTRPGWAPRPKGQVKIIRGWEVPEGAGQDEGDLAQSISPWSEDLRKASIPAQVGTDTLATATPDQLTDTGTSDITPAGSDASTLAPTAAPAAPARSVLPSRAPPRAATTQPSTRGVSSGPSQGPPPQGPSAPIGSGQQAFLQQLAPDAISVSNQTGIPYQLLLAIPANETGWGASVVGNNYFGIKGPGKTSNTWEEVGGQRVNTTASFKVYQSPRESMLDFANLINTSGTYSNVKDWLSSHPNDWRGAARLLQSDGYATDSAWSDKIVNLGDQVGDPTTKGPLQASHGVQSVLDVGSSAIGTKYQWGGAGGRSQFGSQLSPTDCSGFVSWAYEQATGIRLPAQTQAIYQSTVGISPNEAMPGDLVMYNMGQGASLEHVGIYAGNGMMLHDSSINPNGGVDMTPLWSGAEFRRVPGVDPSLITTQKDTTLASSGSDVPENWAITVIHGRQILSGTTSSGQNISQDMGPAGPSDIPGQVIDASWLQGQGQGQDQGGGNEAQNPPTAIQQNPTVPGAGAEKASPLEQAFMGLIDQALSKRLGAGGEGGMGAGDQWFDDPSLNTSASDAIPPDVPADSGLTYYSGGPPDSAAGTPTVLAPPSATTVNRALDLGWGDPALAPRAQGQRDAAAQAPIDQANIQNESQALAARQAGPPPPPQPKPVPSGGLFDLSTPPGMTPPSRQPVSAPLVPQTGPGTARHAISTTSAGTSTDTSAPTLPVPADQAFRDAGSAPTPGVVPTPPAVPGVRQPPDATRGAEIGQAQVLASAQDPIGFALHAAVDNKLIDANAAATIHGGATAVQALVDPASAFPGVSASVQAAARNGIDLKPALDKLTAINPDSATARVQNAVISGKQASPLDMMLAGSEALQRAQDARAEVVKAFQPPGTKGTPEGDAQAQVIAMVSDPLNLVGLGGVKEGTVALQAADRAAPLVEGLVKAGSPEAIAAEQALRRPWTATESQAILQRASLDLSTHAETLAMQDASRALSAGGKYEPLSGEQLRRTVINAVARENPGEAPRAILTRADQILEGAGAHDLTTDVVTQVGPHGTSLDKLGYLDPQMQKLDEMLYTNSDALQAHIDENAQRTRNAQQAIRDQQVAQSREHTWNWPTAPRGTQPAVINTRFALSTALGGVPGGLAARQATWNRVDPGDPNRELKSDVAFLGGAVLGTSAAYLAPMLYRGVDGSLLKFVRGRMGVAPVENLTPEMKKLIRDWSGGYQLGGSAAQRLSNRMRAVFGNLSDKGWLGLASYYEIHGTLPGRFARSQPALDFMHDWEALTSWAVKYDIVPDPINFMKPGSKALRYVPHATADDFANAIKLGADDTVERRGRTSANPFDYFNRFPRKYETLREGMQNKIQYEPNIPKVWGNYAGVAIKRRANEVLRDEMLKMAQVRNPGLFSPAGLAQKVLAGEDIVQLPAGASAGMVTGGIDLGTYMPEFKGQNIYISNSLSRVFDNLFRNPSAFDPAGGVLGVNSFFKHNVLSGSIFHAVNEGRQLFATQGWHGFPNGWKAFAQMVSPGGSRAYWAANSAGLSQAIKDGLQVNLASDIPTGRASQVLTGVVNAIGGAVVGYQTGKNDDERMQHALVGGAIGLGTSLPLGFSPEAKSLVQHFSQALWSRGIPFMKYTTYQMYAPAFGGRNAAEFANEVFGGQNLIAIARSRTTQDVAKGLLLAPDWQEGWARQFGNALFNWGPEGQLGQMNRTYWFNALMQSAFVLEGMNQALGGKWSWQNDPDATLLVNASRLYDVAGWNHTDPTTGNTYTPYIDLLGPYRAFLEPIQQIARAGTIAAASALGYKPEDVPFNKEVYGDFGNIQKPNAGQSLLQFAGSRVGFIPATVSEFVSGRDFAGRPIDQQNDDFWQKASNRFSQSFQHFLPTGEQSILQGMSRGDPTPMAIFSSVTGMRTTRRSDATRYFQFADQFENDLGASPAQWQDMLANSHAQQDAIDLQISAYQSGQKTVLADGTTIDPTNMTAKQRDQQISDLETKRRDFTTSGTQRQLINHFLDNTQVNPDQSAQINNQLNWLVNQSVVGGSNAPSDLSQRPDIDQQALVAAIWNKDPTEIARLSGNLEPTDDAWTNLQRTLDAHLIKAPPGTDAQRQIAQLRQRWVADASVEWNIDPAVMQDVVKQQLYGGTNSTLPLLPGVTSEQLDQMVNDYQKQGQGGLPTDISLAKRQYLVETAAQLGVDESALASRIKLRLLPMTDQDAASKQRSDALDLLSGSKASLFDNPDGTPLGTPQQQSKTAKMLDALKSDKTRYISGTYLSNGKPDANLNTLAAARAQASADRYKTIAASPNKDAYYRWFGNGANMTDAEWAQYQAGTLDMWSDKPAPDVAKQRTNIIDLGQTLTPHEKTVYSQAQNRGQIQKFTVTWSDRSGRPHQANYNLAQALSLFTGRYGLRTAEWTDKGVGEQPNDLPVDSSDPSGV